MLRLLKVMATVLPASAPSIDSGMDPDLIACLWREAFRTKAVNSVELRSAIERRCRGANGEVGGVEGVE